MHFGLVVASNIKKQRN